MVSKVREFWQLCYTAFELEKSECFLCDNIANNTNKIIKLILQLYLTQTINTTNMTANFCIFSGDSYLGGLELMQSGFFEGP